MTLELHMMDFVHIRNRFKLIRQLYTSTPDIAELLIESKQLEIGQSKVLDGAMKESDQLGEIKEGCEKSAIIQSIDQRIQMIDGLCAGFKSLSRQILQD